MPKPIRTLSIKGITWRYLSLVLLLALAGVVIIAAVGSYTSRESVLHHETFERDVLSRDIGDLVGFYRNIAQAAAERQEVKDILEFGDVESAVLWAKELRSILPESIGVALIDPSGAVLGEPLQLKLGKQCVADLKQMLTGDVVSQPPIHREAPALSHFDVVVPVTSDGESLGLLFMSFSLNVLQRQVEQRVGAEQYLRIEDAGGNTIVEKGDPGANAHSHKDPLEAGIPGTDWRMFYLGPGWEGTRLAVLAISVGGVIFVVTMLLTLFLSARLVRFVKSDLHSIRDLLDQVSSEEEITGVVSKTRLRETAAIMEDVAMLVRDIELANAQLKRQSMHDSLTGLLNRRAFDEALLHYVGLAVRGVSSRLVMLDLDLFKQVNDRYGHVVGDEVLIALAETLRERCRIADILARVGGDEFALIMPGDGEADIGQWFEDVDRIFSQKQSRINAGRGIVPQCHISAGSVVIEKGIHRDVKTLMGEVDRKMYEAKRTGRASICY